MSELPEHTKREQEAGRKQVMIATWEMSAEVGRLKLRKLAPRHAVSCWYGHLTERVHVLVQTLPEYVDVFISEEDPDTFPSDRLIAQIMLVAG